MFNIVKSILPLKKCFLYRDVELKNANLELTFYGNLQQGGGDVSFALETGIDHTLFVDKKDITADISSTSLNGYNVIVIENKTYTIIRIKEVITKETQHLEILLRKNAD